MAFPSPLIPQEVVEKIYREFVEMSPSAGFNIVLVEKRARCLARKPAAIDLAPSDLACFLENAEKFRETFKSLTPMVSFWNMANLQVYVSKDKTEQKLLTQLFRCLPGLHQLNLVCVTGSLTPSGRHLLRFLRDSAPALQNLRILRIFYNHWAAQDETGELSAGWTSTSFPKTLGMLPHLSVLLVISPLALVGFSQDSDEEEGDEEGNAEERGEEGSESGALKAVLASKASKNWKTSSSGQVLLHLFFEFTFAMLAMTSMKR